MSEEQKKSIHHVTLPSGLAGEIRRMKLGELDSITSRSTVRRGNVLEKLFDAIWLETTDPGIYKPPFVEFRTTSDEKIIVDWTQVLQGDRNALLLEIRKFTRGSQFDFDVVCRMCKNIINWTINLDDLEVYNLSEEAMRQLTVEGKNEFRRTLPYSGHQVAFKLLQGIDQNQLAKRSAQNPDDQFQSDMSQRLVYISGASTPKERKQFIAEMDAEDMEFLKEEWESTDCDIQMEVTIECHTCNKIQRIALPLDEDFLFKRRSPKRRKSRK